MFAGKHGFITPRDLFRWAERGAVGYEQLAENGFAVLGERLRLPAERDTVAAVLQKTLNIKVRRVCANRVFCLSPLSEPQSDSISVLGCVCMRECSVVSAW